MRLRRSMTIDGSFREPSLRIWQTKSKRRPKDLQKKSTARQSSTPTAGASTNCTIESAASKSKLKNSNNSRWNSWEIISSCRAHLPMTTIMPLWTLITRSHRSTIDRASSLCSSTTHSRSAATAVSCLGTTS